MSLASRFWVAVDCVEAGGVGVCLDVLGAAVRLECAWEGQVKSR